MEVWSTTFQGQTRYLGSDLAGVILCWEKRLCLSYYNSIKKASDTAPSSLVRERLAQIEQKKENADLVWDVPN